MKLDLSLPQNLDELQKSLTERNRLQKLDDWSGSVCFLVCEQNIIFIKRSESMPSHKGQVAFMGGHRKDLETPLETAKREFTEESSIEAEKLSFLGLLDGVRTSGNSLIIPALFSFNGTTQDFVEKANSNGEWDYLIVTNLSYLLDLNNWSTAGFYNYNNQRNELYFCSLPSGELLWGATASMVFHSLNIVKKLIQASA